ncbi:MAG: type II toxin-antitoxin system RelE/ParE family toxin [Cyclobacteriaceae bacterium]
MEIIWSEEAKLDYDENLKYLLKEWSEEVAINFISEVEIILRLIKSNPKLYPLSDYKSIRQAVIRKQITLFYKETGSVFTPSGNWGAFSFWLVDIGSLKIKK